jgi:hypothetical protein
MARARDEAVPFQQPERVADRLDADAEPLGERPQQEALAGLELAVEDPAPELPVGERALRGRHLEHRYL